MAKKNYSSSRDTDSDSDTHLSSFGDTESDESGMNTLQMSYVALYYHNLNWNNHDCHSLWAKICQIRNLKILILIIIIIILAFVLSRDNCHPLTGGGKQCPYYIKMIVKIPEFK